VQPARPEDEAKEIERRQRKHSRKCSCKQERPRKPKRPSLYAQALKLAGTIHVRAEAERNTRSATAWPLNGTKTKYFRLKFL